MRRALVPAVLLAAAALAVAAPVKLDLKAPGRTAEEQARDASNRPAELYEFWGIKEGDTVVDWNPGLGYNTYLLSQAVGPKGKVIAAGRYQFKELDERLKANPLANVQHLDQGIAGIASLPAGSVDAVVTVRNYHDVPPDQIKSLLDAVRKALKPGGVFAVADARAASGRDTENHRIADDVIREEVTAAGFSLEGTSDLLRNKNDDLAKPSWEKRYAIDQSCFKFVKPKA